MSNLYLVEDKYKKISSRIGTVYSSLKIYTSLVSFVRSRSLQSNPQCLMLHWTAWHQSSTRTFGYVGMWRQMISVLSFYKIWWALKCDRVWCSLLSAHQCYQHILHRKKSKSTSSLQASGSLCHLIVDHIESKNTNGINVLLHPSWTPPPVVARGCKCGNTNFHLRQIDENKKDWCSLTIPSLGKVQHIGFFWRACSSSGSR